MPLLRRESLARHFSNPSTATMPSNRSSRAAVVAFAWAKMGRLGRPTLSSVCTYVHTDHARHGTGVLTLGDQGTTLVTGVSAAQTYEFPWPAPAGSSYAAWYASLVARRSPQISHVTFAIERVEGTASLFLCTRGQRPWPAGKARSEEARRCLLVKASFRVASCRDTRAREEK